MWLGRCAKLRLPEPPRRRRVAWFARRSQMVPIGSEAKAAELAELHRYVQRRTSSAWSSSVGRDDPAEDGGAPVYAGENWNESWLSMSYWYGRLYISCRRLRAPPNQDLVKRGGTRR